MEKIDIVVLWVDGSDEKWLDEKRKYSPVKSDAGQNRYRDWGLMKYWFRGIDKFAPWVNKVFFVTYGHLPDFLNVDFPKLEIVRHDEFIPQKYLPTFNAHTIELNLHRIKGLSEQFIYFNDDMFLCMPVEKSTFFKKGLPCEEGVEGGSSTPGDGNLYYHILLNDIDLINRNFDKHEVMREHFFKYFNIRYGIDNLRTLCLFPWKKYAGFKNSHLPSAYRKSVLEELWEKEEKILDKTCAHKFRNIEDVNQYVFRYWQLVTGKFCPRGKIGMRYDISKDTIRQIDSAIRTQKYKAICLNDPDYLEDFEDCQAKISSAFEQILPDKCGYEV